MTNRFLNKNKILRIVVRILCILPLIWFGYKLYFQDLGPQPADQLNKKLGNLGILLLIANLWIGIVLSFVKPFPEKLRFLLRERRFLGVVSGVYLILHFVMYVFKEGLEWDSVQEILEKRYLTAGAMALTLILVLTVTSTNWAVKTLKYKNWKTLHRLVYAALGFACVHVFLIEKINLLKYALILSPVVVLELARFIKTLIKQKKVASA